MRPALLGVLAVVAAATSCATESETRATPTAARAGADDGRLSARPRRVVRAAPRGRLGLAHEAELYVPQAYTPKRAAPLVLTLHGANGGPGNGFGQLLPLADDAGLILLAPKSRRATWDILYRDLGPDVKVIDELLAHVFARYNVDPRRVYISGFSDGASYALSLGLANGDLFRAIVAFSPGFADPPARRGKPRIFVSHGTRDTVLPIGMASRRIVGKLRSSGYRITYREFPGPHTVPPRLARAAVAWLAR